MPGTAMPGTAIFLPKMSKIVFTHTVVSILWADKIVSKQAITTSFYIEYIISSYRNI